jgi:nicotinamide riboside kinase
MVKRIALVGSSSTGKTTVYELLKNKLPKYEFVNESTRSVKKYDFAINESGTDATQLAISSFHLEALLKPYNLVLDRCYMDLVVYTRNLPNVRMNTKAFIQNTWNRVKDEYTHYIYFPIEFDAVDDGVRSVNEKWRRKVDEGFIEQLEQLPDYKRLTITGSPMQRVDQIMEFIK